MDDLLKIIGKVIGVTGGLALIALVMIWFGVVPLVAAIFDGLSFWALVGLFVVMIGTVVLIIERVMK